MSRKDAKHSYQSAVTWKFEGFAPWFDGESQNTNLQKKEKSFDHWQKTEIILVSRKDAKHFLSITSDFQGKSGVSIRTWLYSKKFGSRRFGTTVVANRDLFRGSHTALFLQICFTGKLFKYTSTNWVPQKTKNVALEKFLE